MRVEPTAHSPRPTAFLQFFALASSIVGALLNASGLADLLVMGYWVWLVANVLWIVFAWRIRQWGMLALFAFYLVLSVVGLCRWQ